MNSHYIKKAIQNAQYQSYKVTQERPQCSTLHRTMQGPNRAKGKNRFRNETLEKQNLSERMCNVDFCLH